MTENQTQKSKSQKKEDANNQSYIKTILFDYFINPNVEISLAYLNFIFVYFFGLLFITGVNLKYWYFLTVIPPMFLLCYLRRSIVVGERSQIAHRIPYFAESIANSLSVGMTLEQAFEESIYFLKGRIRGDFEELLVKISLGKDLGTLLNSIDKKYPNTGLRYLISLLEQYRVLGVGISPLLKRISDALIIKNESEDKIHALLSAGTSYARLAIGVFLSIFVVFTLMLKDQVKILTSPDLRSVLIFLLVWSSVGIIFVTKLSSIDFARNHSLKPYIKQFYDVKDINDETLFFYSGLKRNEKIKRIYYYSPLIAGMIIAYITSMKTGDPLFLFLAFAIGTGLGKWLNQFLLKAVMEEQLIKTIEIFPEFLQVFIIGLNSGLNRYLALEFATDAIRGSAPKLLVEELYRTKFAMECGESPGKSWELFANTLPFELIIDFTEIMVTAPMHGDSIVGSLSQMGNSYQIKKMTLIEKKAGSLGQIVVPIIVISLFPLFMFAVFGPLVSQIKHIFAST